MLHKEGRLDSLPYDRYQEKCEEKLGMDAAEAARALEALHRQGHVAHFKGCAHSPYPPRTLPPRRSGLTELRVGRTPAESTVYLRPVMTTQLLAAAVAPAVRSDTPSTGAPHTAPWDDAGRLTNRSRCVRPPPAHPNLRKTSRGLLCRLGGRML